MDVCARSVAISGSSVAAPPAPVERPSEEVLAKLPSNAELSDKVAARVLAQVGPQVTAIAMSVAEKVAARVADRVAAAVAEKVTPQLGGLVSSKLAAVRQ